MSELMNISVNGQSQVPPGFRFHPTEEELLHYYLRKKISHKKVDLDVIHEVDLNKLEPWDIQERCKIGTTAQTDWYFFSHKDKKYPSGTRTNRATVAGFWKATGRDKVIYSNSSRNIIGMRKTLVFYTGRAPHGQKSDWIMYEYRLIDDLATNNNVDSHCQQQATSPNQVAIESCQEEGWVVCRISKKRNHQQKGQLRGYKVAEPRPKLMPNSPSEEEEEEKKVDTMNTISFNPIEAVMIKDYDCFDHDQDVESHESGGSDNNIIKWAAVDQLVACQLNGQTPDHDHDKEVHFQAFSSLTRRTNHSEICSLWGLI